MTHTVDDGPRILSEKNLCHVVSFTKKYRLSQKLLTPAACIDLYGGKETGRL